MQVILTFPSLALLWLWLYTIVKQLQTGQKGWYELFLQENSLEKACAMLATKMGMTKKSCVKLTYNWNTFRLERSIIDR